MNAPLTHAQQQRLKQLLRVFKARQVFTRQDVCAALQIGSGTANETLAALRECGFVQFATEQTHDSRHFRYVYSFGEPPEMKPEPKKYAKPQPPKPRKPPKPQPQFAGTVIKETEDGYTVGEVWRTYGTGRKEIRPVATVRTMRQAVRLEDKINGKHPAPQKSRGKANLSPKRMF